MLKTAQQQQQDGDSSEVSQTNKKRNRRVEKTRQDQATSTGLTLPKAKPTRIKQTV